MVRAVRGILITCDAPVRAIIERLHQKTGDVVIETLDDTHIMIQESKLEAVKLEIKNVIYKKEEESMLQEDSEEETDEDGS